MSEPPDHRGTYADGRAYRLARGRRAPRSRIDDLTSRTRWVVHLDRERPSADEFIARTESELKIRFYQPRTRRSYRHVLRGFLGWCGIAPHEVTRADVRDYLELLVDAGCSGSWVSVTLSALRTLFDKFCGRSITLGLVTPRRSHRLPVVLDPKEIIRVLRAAPSLRDKVLIGLMYATGARVGEVVRLRFGDLDYERGLVYIRQGKGRKDRQVMLPESFRGVLQRFGTHQHPAAFLFPAGTAPNRHLSPRTVQRAVARAVEIAGIEKRVTPHSFRHAFASHLLENATDIRFIQQLLGHEHLETTTLYTKVAKIPKQRATSPLDRLLENAEPDRESCPQSHHPPRQGVSPRQLSPRRSRSARSASSSSPAQETTTACQPKPRPPSTSEARGRRRPSPESDSASPTPAG